MKLWPILVAVVTSAQSPVTIGITNQSTNYTDAQVQQWTRAIQKQIDGDLRPVWHVSARLQFRVSGDWTVTVRDSTGVLGITGQHGTTTGQPWGVATDSLSLSHEVMEMLVDPYFDAFELVSGPGSLSYAYAREICDPVRNASYLIDGVQVSDFVLPAYFWHQSGPFDHLGVAAVGLQPSPMGYQLYQTLSNWLGTWIYAWGAACAFGPC
jgi:hypothetical protein